MFTGIVTDVGRVRKVTRQGDWYLEIGTAYETQQIEIGASVACAGICLTAVDKGPGWFAVNASAETVRRSTLGSWDVDTPVNLERALKVGDELGGHILSGHVDGLAEAVGRRPEGDSLRFEFAVPPTLARYVAPKGSIALDGVSLTVNEVEGSRFSVNVIPHTRKATTFDMIEVGAKLNMEVDLLARYVARLLDKGSA